MGPINPSPYPLSHFPYPDPVSLVTIYCPVKYQYLPLINSKTKILNPISPSP